MKKSEKYALGSTIVSYVVLILLLLFIILPGKEPEEEGLMISFGELAEGSGKNEQTVQTEETLPQEASSKDDKMMTQEDPSVFIAEKEKKEQEQRDALDKRKRQEEQERKRKELEAINKAGELDGLFGQSGGSGSGSSAGSDKQGNPAGSGTQGGNSWSLNGRGLNGNLVSPDYEKNVEGMITVQIRVDADGQVVSATLGKPTTISDLTTQNAAIRAAKRTRFTGGASVSIGTISYNFKLR